MKDENWLDMVKKQGELRHFGSLAIRKTQKGNQISAQEIDFLFRVAFAKELMTPGQLAMATGVSKTIISRLTEQLERKKFISKERDEIDRRSYVIRVTDSGKEEIDRIGQLSSFLSYANQYTKPFNEISGVVTELQNALACAARIFELIEEANNILS